MRRDSLRDRQLIQEMWAQANNAPLALAALQPHGVIDREDYRRYVDGLIIELTLETNPQTRVWSYELAILHPGGEILEGEVVEYWLEQFFGTEVRHAAKRGFMITADARYTFPYRRS